MLEETEIISDGEAEDETMKIDTAAMIQKRIHSVVESLEQIQLPNADDTADPKGEGTSKRQRLDASALGSRALSPFPEPGKVDLSEACPRQNDSLCFQYMMVDIWNHSIVTEDFFVNPWQASIAAIDLAQDVGTLQSSPSTLTLPCHKRHFAGRVSIFQSC